MKHIIRNSDRYTFKTCRRKWGWNSPLRGNFRPRVTPKPLEFGIAWHEAMAVLYDPDTWHLLKDPSQRAFVYAAVHKRFDEVVAAQLKVYQEDKELFIEAEEDFKDRLILGHGMLDNYFAWALVNDNFTPVKVEVSFEATIPDPRRTDTKQLYLPSPAEEGVDWPVVYQGRIDGLVQDYQGWYWILEHKTAGQFGDMRHLELDEQITSYMWGLRAIGFPVRGVIYSEAFKAAPEKVSRNLTQRKGRWLSVNKMQRVTYESYLAAIHAHKEDPAAYEDFLEYLKVQPNPFFRRFVQYRTTAELDQIERQLGWEAIDMLTPDLPLYPTPGKFNCSYCSFREPCITLNQGGDVDFLLNNLFVKQEDRNAIVPIDHSDENEKESTIL